MTGKKAHEVEFSIPLTFRTHSMLHNFSSLSFIYFMHGFLSKIKLKEIGYKMSNKKKKKT